MICNNFIEEFNKACEYCYNSAVNKGFYSEEFDEARFIALCHEELSEALKGIRMQNPPDEKIPEFLTIETELADLLIRVMAHAKYKKYRVAEALKAKMEYNQTRPWKHGKIF